MNAMTKRMKTLRSARDRGASAVEYGLLVALIAVVIAATIFGLGTVLRLRFFEADRCVSDPTDTAKCKVHNFP